MLLIYFRSLKAFKTFTLKWFNKLMIRETLRVKINYSYGNTAFAMLNTPNSLYIFRRRQIITCKQSNIYFLLTFGVLGVKLGKDQPGSEWAICHSTRDIHRKYRLPFNFANLHFSLPTTSEYGPVLQINHSNSNLIF